MTAVVASRGRMHRALYGVSARRYSTVATLLLIAPLVVTLVVAFYLPIAQFL